ALAAANERLRQLESQPRPASAPSVVDMAVTFDVGKLSLDSVRRLPGDVGKWLGSSAKKVFIHPVDAVGDARRALEAAILCLAKVAPSAPRPKMYEVLDALRGDAAIPADDWFLMKNLWHRASAVVHE